MKLLFSLRAFLIDLNIANGSRDVVFCPFYLFVYLFKLVICFFVQIVFPSNFSPT